MKIEKQIEASCFAVDFLIQALHLASNTLRPFDLCESARTKTVRFSASQRIAIFVDSGKEALHIVLDQFCQAVDCVYARRIAIAIFDGRNPGKNGLRDLKSYDRLLVIISGTFVVLQRYSDFPQQVDDRNEVAKRESETCRHGKLLMPLWQL
jgi:hypothetical protein